MLLRLYIPDKKVIEYIEDYKYNICTVRSVLKRNYGFKNTKEILDKYSPMITESFLKQKLAYKDDKEYSELSLYLSKLMNYVEERVKDVNNLICIRGFHLLYFHRESDSSIHSFCGDSTNSLIKFHFKTVYSKLIRKEPCFNKYIKYYGK